MKKLIMVGVVLALVCSMVIAKGKIVNCQIESNNIVVYKGKCSFATEKSAKSVSFSLANPKDKDKPLYDSILMVSVYVENGVAEVRGLTSDGINSRWGVAQKSKQDKRCWDGDDFKVCVKS